MLLSKDEKDCERVELKNLDAANNFCVDFDTNKYDHIYFENKNGVKTSRVYPGNSSIGVEYKLAANGNTLTHIFTRDIDESTGRVDNFELTDEKNLAYRDDKSKKISVFVPSTYDASTPADILYFFDAQNLFCNAGKYTENGDPYGSWQLDVAFKNLYEERGKNVIVVGIDNADKYRSNELFMDHRKFGELSPLAKNIEGDNFSTGYLDGLSDFIVNTLHPFIKQKYNVKEDNIGIGGSSMGGIASFYCALHKMGFYK